MQISLKSLLSDVRSGFATLPHLTVYREELDDHPVDTWEGDTITCLYSSKTKRLFLSLPDIEYKKSVFLTLSRKGFEKHKKLLWEEFDKYQNENKSRYYDKVKKQKIKLTEQNFYDTVAIHYDEMEYSTLLNREIYENRIDFIKRTCEYYGLDYEKFKEKRKNKI